MKNFFYRKDENTLYDNLEKEVFRYPGTKAVVRMAHLLAGFLVTGSSRSGKTSAVLKFIVKMWFRAGYGGLFTTTRVGDAATIRQWAIECGCGDYVVLFDKDSEYSMSMLEYEMSRTDGSGGDTAHMANNILMIHELISNFEAGGSSSKNEEPFWKNASKTLIVNGIELMKMAGMPITWKNLRLLAMDGFTEEDVVRYVDLCDKIEFGDSIESESARINYETWCKNNTFLFCFDRVNIKEDLSQEELVQFHDLGDYWLRQFPKLAEKTKSIVIEILVSVCRPFESSGILKKHFSIGVSEEIHPDRTIFDNKIVIVDFGAKAFGVNGVCATAILKLIYQQAWERRDLEKEGPDANPVMLMIDEFQYYINNAGNADPLFTSTAGGSLVAQCYVTQNVENVIMAMGGKSMESNAKSLMGNLNTKIIAANSDHATNQWAEDMIGKHFVDTVSTTVNEDGSTKRSYNQSMQPKVPVSHFTTLKTGRKENKFEVGTIVFQTGRTWDDGENFKEVTFSQKD